MSLSHVIIYIYSLSFSEPKYFGVIEKKAWLHHYLGETEGKCSVPIYLSSNRMHNKNRLTNDTSKQKKETVNVSFHCMPFCTPDLREK